MRAKAVTWLLVALCVLLCTPAPGVADERFDYVWAYYEGVAQFEKDGQIGLLDISGNIITPAAYDSIDPRSVNGLREARKDGLTGLLDAEGALWQGRLFDELFWFSRENALLMFREEGSDAFGLMRANGEIVHPPTWYRYEFVELEINYLGESFEDQPFFCYIADYDRGAGLMNDRGEWLLPDMRGDPRFDDYTNGRVRFRADAGDTYFCGAVDKTGVVIEPVWDDIKLPTDGELFAVCREGRWGFVDMTGEVVIPLEWAEVHVFEGDYAPVRGDDGKWGIINTKGELVIPAVWPNLWHHNGAGSGDLIAAKDENGKWGMLDMAGNIVVNFSWDRIRRYHEGTALVEKDGRYGFVHNNEEVELPLPYDDITYKTETVYGVSKDGAGGYVSVDGTPLTALEFDPVNITSWYTYVVEELIDWLPGIYSDASKGCMYINLKGEVMLEGEWIDATPFFEGYACVKKRMAGSNRTLEGVIDRAGNVVIPCEYYMVFPKEGNLWRVIKDGVEGWIGPDFKVISGIKR